MQRNAHSQEQLQQGLISNPGGLSGVALFLAVAIIVTWLIMLLFLIWQTTATEVVWARLLIVLSSMEAVAFGAAGALFGTHIQRQRVHDASARAEKAEKEALDNQDANAKGKALATAVRVSAKARKSAPSLKLNTAEQGAPDAELVALADALFPE
jgi:hypothetical protein